MTQPALAGSRPLVPGLVLALAVLAPLYSWYDSFMAASERGKTALNAFRDAIIQNTLEFMRDLPGQFMRGLRELPGVLFGGGAAAAGHDDLTEPAQSM